MKEYDETEAVDKMMASCLPARVDENDVCEVLDLIFDYYDENGELDIDCEDDTDTDIEAMTEFIERYLRKNGAPDIFSHDQIVAMIRAEIEYEDSLL